MLNTRLQLQDGRKGIVRFIGIINNIEMVGIEFDNKTDGKHDGNGYFTIHKEHSASLFKLDTLKLSDFVSLEAAIQDKYFTTVDNYTSTIGHATLETIGWTKTQDQITNNLSTISLINCCINSLHISTIFHKVTELYLNNNLISDLSLFPSKSFPSLQLLDISSNRFTNLQLPSCQISNLLISNTLIPFSSIPLLVSNCPLLTSLSCAFNHYYDENISIVLPQVKELDISNNYLTNLSIINQFVPNLVHLNVSYNHINTISNSIKLSSLNISNNKLFNFNFLNCLDVVQLRLLRNEIDAVHARYFSIVLIPSLELINGSAISLNDKKDAEMHFLKHYTDQLHPKYIQLKSLWSYKAESLIKPLTKQLIMVHFTCKNQTKSKKISPTLDIDMVIRIVKRLFSLNNDPYLFIGDILITESLGIYIFEEKELNIVVK